MHFKIYTVIYFFNLHSIVRYWCSPAYLLFEVALNFSCVAAVGSFLPSSLMMVFTVSKMSCLPSLRMLKFQTCLSPLESHDYFLPQSELAACKGRQILPLWLNVWFFLIFLSFPWLFRDCHSSLVSGNQMLEGIFFWSAGNKDKAYFEQICWF